MEDSITTLCHQSSQPTHEVAKLPEIEKSMLKCKCESINGSLEIDRSFQRCCDPPLYLKKITETQANLLFFKDSKDLSFVSFGRGRLK